MPVYWIVDPGARSVEVWRLAEGAAEPETIGPDGTLRWAPFEGAAELEVGVGELLPG